MGADTKIEWARHTHNPWLGCERLSPACDHCYAADWAKRYGEEHLWQGQRRRTSEQVRRQPLRWNRAALAAGERHRVFCGSLMDVFDNQVPPEWRAELFRTIEATQALDWMLLTKRPQNIAKMLAACVEPVDGDIPFGPLHAWPYPNVWLGTTIEDRKRLINADHLRAVPAAVRFLSIEPLLEDLGEIDLTGIHLVIVGGESGPRPMRAEWVRSIRDQCEAAGVAFFFKQWGSFLPAGQTQADGRIWAPGCGTRLHATKAITGRLLDGVTHDAMPEPRA